MMLPTQDFRRTHILTPKTLHKGLDSVFHGLLGRHRRRRSLVLSLRKQAEEICDASESLRHVADSRLRERLQEVQMVFRRQSQDAEKRLPEALSLMVEAAARKLGLRPYPVQIMGAVALFNGYLAEMATGEGKSLTACLPSVLAAWTGRPCHFVTVNDYLAGRDAGEMRPFYAFCGVSVGCVLGEMDPRLRRINYKNGVVYTTLKELVADFLRDRLLLGNLQHPQRRMLRQMLDPRFRDPEGLVLRGLDTVIVDEADSVLIDEAVTPLIISRAQENQPLVDACRRAHRIASVLVPTIDYRVDAKYKEIRFTKAGFAKLEEMAEQLPGIWRGPARREELIRQALTAREFYKKDQQYVRQDDKITIVDEFTGRLMPNRTWRHGLHQAVEANEALEISNPSETLARLSFQRFFRFFRKLGGMTGTAQEAASEFWHIYQLPVIPIPTNRPCIRQQLPDVIFSSAAQKWDAVAREVARIHESGRPILVGTRSVWASERLAERLTAMGVEFDLLNAVRHREEARIVAAAGERGRITIATNMAGRGTDIKLGRGIADDGGLHVIATERHESGRIDRQLFGRCARQGDPGIAQAFISAEDELVTRFVPAAMRRRLFGVLEQNAPGAGRLAQMAIAHAQRAAQRLAYKQRRNVLKMDTWLEEALSFTGPGSEF